MMRGGEKQIPDATARNQGVDFDGATSGDDQDYIYPMPAVMAPPLVRSESNDAAGVSDSATRRNQGIDFDGATSGNREDSIPSLPTCATNATDDGPTVEVAFAFDAEPKWQTGTRK